MTPPAHLASNDARVNRPVDGFAESSVGPSLGLPGASARPADSSQSNLAHFVAARKVVHPHDACYLFAGGRSNHEAGKSAGKPGANKHAFVARLAKPEKFTKALGLTIPLLIFAAADQLTE